MGAKQWSTLLALSLVELMVALDVTVINIALPKAQVALDFSNANRSWLVTAYALAFGSLMLLGGRLSNLWGRRNALCIGLVGFAVASLLGGMANSFTQLVIARAAQGAFGALLAPAVLAALTTTFTTSHERARAFTIYGAIGGSGAAIGLLIGGFLTEWSWRWCLFINVIVALIALVAVALTVSGGRELKGAGIEPTGTLLASAGLVAMVFGFTHAVNSGWGSYKSWGSLVASGVLLLLFTWWQERATHPLLPLRIVRDRNRAASLVALFLTSMALFGISLFLAYYLENILHDSPLRTGVLLLPLVLALIVSATLASARLLDLVGPRPLVPVGMVLAMLGMILFTRLSPSASYVSNIAPGLILTGLGLGLIFAPAIATATSGIEARDAGAASAMVNVTQQIGGSVGTALLNTIAVSASLAYFHSHPYQSVNASSYRDGILHGDAVGFWWAAGFLGFGALVSFVVLESGAVTPEEPSIH